MRRLATQRFVPSAGLARVLGIGDPILLPSGADPGAPDLGVGAEPVVAYVGSLGWADGFDRLLAAMAIVRDRVPAARLRVIGPLAQARRLAELPDWVELRQAARNALPDLLREARLCVIPRPITEYTDLAIPVKLLDYLSYGKPVVATAARETRAVLEASGAGILTGDSPAELAEGIRALLEDEDRAREMGRRARGFASSRDVTWDARARTVLSSLLPERAEDAQGDDA
jgi:glycosyltransferase involved in cell wall biosynthesis